MTVPSNTLQPCNSSVFDGCEDLAMLSILNEASVIDNLKTRYKRNMIHTYSGLFCITVNPWRWLPIYSPKLVLVYKGQTLSSMPPHIYAVADNVYNSMLQDGRNQSILITGESGAGKTENTKKIVQYFTTVAAQKLKEGGISLEKQICETSPVLEAFGNAKSTHNDNSSRFGKFIYIWFNENGKVSKALINSYLLEKSRLVSQSSNERSYHIFYQLLSSATSKELKEHLRLTGDPKDYNFLQNGLAYIEDYDDAEGMKVTERGLNILNFTPEERMNLFEMTAASVVMGQIRFRSKHKDDEIVVPESIIQPEHVCTLLGIDTLSFLRGLTEPTVTVRGELVKQSRNLDQVIFSVIAVSKAVYEKMFDWLVKRCNLALTSKRGRNRYFVGILDISGFEIFQLNSFEQLCINYTNEKLQCFFNHQMFEREQDDYELEGIEWKTIDFSLDLQPTIDLIEKPMGILSILEEECIMPKGTEAAFLAKMNEQHIGKSPTYSHPKGGPKANAHFCIKHYAGMVSYNIDGWLDKNKDPLTTCIIDLFKRSKNSLVQEIWKNSGVTESKPGENDDKKSRKTLSTVSTVFREQLSNLMSILNATHAHFIRCVVPNYERKPGVINGPLVLNQLRCNGVLESLRIVSNGFPNKMQYEDFAERFRIMNTAEGRSEENDKIATTAICDTIGLNVEDNYALGMTKIFFRVGVLSYLEKLRTNRMNQIITQVQAQIRSYLILEEGKQLEARRDYINIIQQNIRWWIDTRRWEWFKLFKKVKPAARYSTELLQKQLKTAEEEREQLKKKLKDALKANKALKLKNDSIRSENEHMKSNVEDTMGELKSELEMKGRILEQKETENKHLQQTLERIEQALEEEGKQNRTSTNELLLVQKQFDENSRSNTIKQHQMEMKITDLRAKASLLTETVQSLNEQLDERNDAYDKVMTEKDTLQKRVTSLESSLQKSRSEKRHLEHNVHDLQEDNNDLMTKVDQLTKKLEQQINDTELKQRELIGTREQLHISINEHYDQINNIKEANETLLKQMQDKNDGLHKKALKLESENQRLKAEIFADEQKIAVNIRKSESTDRMVRKHQHEQVGHRVRASPSPNREGAASIITSTRKSNRLSSEMMDMIAIQIEDLERQKLELIEDKRMMRREIETCTRAMEDACDEKTTLSGQLIEAHAEIKRLKRRMSSEREHKEKLIRENREVKLKKQKTDELLLEKGVETGTARVQALVSKAEAAAETRQALGRLAGVEKLCNTLQQEMETYKKGIDEAQMTIQELEEKLRGQRGSQMSLDGDDIA